MNTEISNYIDQYNWSALEHHLEHEHGFIHKFLGGRYIGDRYMEYDGFSDLSKICWKVFEVSHSEQFHQLPIEKRLPLKNVISQLRRLYDESEKARVKTCCLTSLATRAYDLFERMFDGYSPVGRLEYEVLPDLK